MEPLISVIVPIYQVEKYLHKCINSILEQSYSNIECILIDDGSQDGCPQICDEYAKRDERVKVIHKENGGLSAARNTGLDIASGEYICFVDSDDWIHLEYIEKMYKAIRETEADIAICDMQYVYEESYNGEKGEQVSPIKRELLDQKTALEKLVLPYSWYYVVAWNKLYHKSIFNNLRFPVGKYHEDEAIIHRIFLRASKTVTIPVKLYYYLQRQESIMHLESKDLKKEKDAMEAFLDQADVLKSLEYRDCYKKLCIRCWGWYLKIWERYTCDNCNRVNYKIIQRGIRRFSKEIIQNYESTFKGKLKLFIILFIPGLAEKLFKRKGR